jgi:hypothetical protein
VPQTFTLCLLYLAAQNIREANESFENVAKFKGSWRKLHNDELHSLYSSPNIVRVIKSRNMRLAVNVARTGRGEVFTWFRLGVRREETTGKTKA